MTGVEAVSNGVPAFSRPRRRTPRRRSSRWPCSRITMFVGRHAPRARLPRRSRGTPRRSSRSWGAAIFGGAGRLYYLVQAATTLILVLAANTAYADFPRLASIVARDRYLPRQFMNQGDRLAFSNGILVLIGVRRGPDRRLPRRHARADPALHDRRVRVVHAVAGRHGPPVAQRAEAGLATRARSSTASARWSPRIVLVIVASRSTLEGAWIILLLHPRDRGRLPRDPPALRSRRLAADAARLRAATASAQHGRGPDRRRPPRRRRGAPVRATLSDDVRAVYVDVDPPATEQIRERLGRVGRARDAGRARLAVSVGDGAACSSTSSRSKPSGRDDYVTVILPEFVPARWWQHLLHNQRALLIKGALLFRPNTVVTSVPFHLAK